MQIKKIEDYIIVRLQRGEELVSKLMEIAKEEGITLATVSGIGSFNYVKLGVYSVHEKKYYANEFREELELTSISGNLSTMDGKPYVHTHANFGRMDGTVIGGHLNEARVCATSEIFIHLIDGELDRFYDDEVGLNLLDLS